jgi:ketosteroid isomerase-like protein
MPRERVIKYHSMGSATSALDEVRLAVASTNDLFITEVYGRGNIKALDEIYTSDARILPPGALMVSGREAIKKFWSDRMQPVNAKRSAVLESVDAMLDHEGAVEIGRATLAVEPEGQSAAQIEVKYVVYWRQENGRWKWHVDIRNQNA